MRDTNYFISFFRTFASLLAKEGINVVLDNELEAPGAFDTVRRVLYYRPLDKSQSDAEFGVICHEIGHAMFTNANADFIEEYDKVFRIFNIIEDGYQERMLCLKYRSMRTYLKNAFDFFFTSKEAVEKIDNNDASVAMTILNVLNYNCKGLKYGYRKTYPDEVKQNKQHMALLNRAENLNDDDIYKRGDVAVEIREMLDDYLTEEERKAAEKSFSGSASGKGTGQGTSKPGESDDEVFDGYGSGLLGTAGGTLTSGERNYDIATRNSQLDDLIAEHVYDHHNKIKLTNVRVADFGQLVNFINDDSCRVEKFDWASGRASLRPTRNKTVEATAARLYSQFMMKANAKNYRKRKTYTTGSLDPARLHKHNWSESLYKTRDVLDREKNHSYVFMLDVSGSMSCAIAPMFDKLAELKRFCELAGVEHEIWTYTTGGYFLSQKDSSKPSNKQITTQTVSNTGSNKFVDFSNVPVNILHNVTENEIEMGGTNIMEAMMLGHGRLITKNTDKKVLVVLTDGQDNSTMIDKSVRVFGIDKHCENRISASKHLCDVMKKVNGHETLIMTYGFHDDGVEHMKRMYELPVVNVKEFDSSTSEQVVDNAFIKQLADRIM